MAGSAILRGRADHQAAIGALLDGAAEGRGGALLLHGEVGVGKSALLADAAGRAARGDRPEPVAPGKPLSAKGSRARRFTVLATGGSEKEARLPFAGLHRLVEPVLRYVADLPPSQSAALTTVIESGECPGPDSFALAAAVLGLLRSAAGAAPVLCCIDDTQWIDQPSLDALAFVARRVGADPIALLFAGCDSSGWFEAGRVEPIAGVPGIAVGEVDHRTSREILTDLLPDDLAGDVAGVVAGLAGGNPLALADLARSLSAEQRRGEAVPPSGLPSNSALRRAIRARLGRLPTDTRWLVLLAAADEDLDVACLVRAATASGLGIDALEPAELSNVIQVVGAELRFPQPLVRSIVYDEATLAQRRAAHTVLAHTLEPQRHPLRRSLHLAAVSDAPNPKLARELVAAAAEQPSARPAASRALECAAALSADPIEAAGHLVAAARYAWEGGEPHRARMLLRRLPHNDVPPHLHARAELLLGEIEMRVGATTHARQTLLAAASDLSGDRNLALSAMMRAGEALFLTGDYGRYGELARYALELREAGESPRTELLFEQFAGLTAMFNGSYRTGVASLRRVVELAHELDDPLALIRASMAAVVLGDDAQANRLALRAAAVARGTGDASAVPQALELAGAAEIALGRYDAATANLLEGLPLARETGQETLASSISATLALIAATMGDKESCLRWLRDARSHGPSQGVNRCQAIIDWALALLDLIAGRPAEALTRLQALMTWRSGRGQVVIQIAATPHLIEAAMRCGERSAAVTAFGFFEAWARRTDNPAWLAVLARCRALMATSEDEADTFFREALSQHRAGESEFERARTELLYGQELRRARRPSAAREHLRAALEAFQCFDAAPWVALAAAELRAAGDHVEHRSVALADALTPQQMQIARLAAAGATNREVARHLFLSPRTVDHHMRNIFARLGIRSRVDLAKLMT